MVAYENVKKNRHQQDQTHQCYRSSDSLRRVHHPDPNRSYPRIYITNPFRGILIIWGAGARKNKSLIEPIIQQTIQQGQTGLLYDFKFPSLARVATRANQTGPGQSIYYVNFD
ncbi:hypothetical protein [Spirosoma lituiforme]